MSELKKAIDQISKDRGLDRVLLIDTLEEAVRSAVARKHGDTMDIEVTFNEVTGEIDVYQFKVVVAEVHDPVSELTREEALTHDTEAQIDDEMGFKVKIEDLGRIAAQSAKQVIIQRMRDAEQEIIYDEYFERKGEIVSGIIQRRDRTGWIINLGRTEALLPKDEQIARERYKRGDRIQAYILDVLKESRGPQVMVSRSHPNYTVELFRREVPEVSDGTVKIMGVSRDPGLRAKVAVMSRERDVDPVGACVGIRGSRIQNVVQEMKGERIDIVVWSPEIATYAQHALSPAIVTRIAVYDDDEKLEVVVPDDQLTLAIGRKGQNVKLASRLLGWKIDILTESRYAEAHENHAEIDQIADVVDLALENFLNEGFDTLASIAEASDDELLAISGLTESKLESIRMAINMLTPTGNKGPSADEDIEDESTEDESTKDESVEDESADKE